jgi:hypothetical protein
MLAAVEVQELAETRAALAAPPVPAAGAPLGHEPGFLQGEADEAVRERHAVVASREVVEVSHVEAEVLLAVQAQNALHLEGRRLAPRGPAPATITQGELAARFEPGPPAAQAAGIHPENVGGLQPRQRSTQRPHDDLLHLHGPLHGGRGKDHRHLLG